MPDIKPLTTQNLDGPTRGAGVLPAGFFVFRTPLLPFREFLSWGEGLAAPAALDDDAPLEQTLARDRACLRQRLATIAQRAVVRDALFVAAPNIIERFHLWTGDPDSERGRKVEHVLVRYFSRMTGRATPFGLFAGISVGAIGPQTQLLMAGCGAYQRHTRLDMDYIFALTDALAREPELRSLFAYHPNSSLYRAAGRVRYVESRLKDKARTYHLVAVEDTDYLDDTLALAEPGATVEALTEALVNDEISSTEARDYVTQLIDCQILVPEISPPVTGPEPIQPLISLLRANDQTAAFADTLDCARIKLEEIDQAGLGVAAQEYQSVARLLEQLPAKVELSRLFQVDMVKPAPEATLGGKVLEEIVRGVDVLHRLARRPALDLLSRFREAFVARYEQREVPLVEALDEEIGVGFGTSDETSPLLQGLAVAAAPEEISTEPGRNTMLLRKLSEALQHGAVEITFDSSELQVIGSQDPLPLPDSFAIDATVAAESQSALTQGDFQVFLQSGAGPSGANLLGRFCHMDESLRRNVESYLRAEEALQPNAVFAEIVHLPEGRLGNVIFRPALREFEIPYLGRSAAPRERQISVTDLRVSVQGNQIRLRSARSGRDVIPRMTNAHNYIWGSLGVYRFLGMLQHQGTSACPPWDWGVLWSAPFLPRVISGRLVLSLARWRLNKEELRALAGKEDAARFRAMQMLRAKRRFPRLVALVDADNLLPVDLDNVLSVDSFIQLVKEREEVVVQEIFPGPDHLCAQGPEGRFVHELVVPFLRKNEGGRMQDELRGSGQFPSSLIAHPSSFAPPPSSFKRCFPPGSEWLYAKLYTGVATADALLRDIVRPLIESLRQSAALDQWFFVRYGDPEWHLRLRLHGSPRRLHRDVLPALQDTFNPLLDDGRLWRWQFDTYEREVERYGGAEGIILAERLFHLDSEVALELIEMLEPGDEGVDERWRLTLYGIDRLLMDFGLDLRGKLEVLKKVRQGFAKEFRVEKNLTAQLSEKFRKERRSLESLLAASEETEHPLAPGLAVLHRRSTQIIPIVAALKASAETDRLSGSLAEILPSYVHMHANRVLRSAHRMQEFVIYDLLVRVYESRLARTP